MDILKRSIKDDIICLLHTEDLKTLGQLRALTLSVGLLICSALKSFLLYCSHVLPNSATVSCPA